MPTSTSVHTHSYAKIPFTIKPKPTSNLPFNRHPIFKSKTCHLFATLTSSATFTGNHRRLRGSTIRAGGKIYSPGPGEIEPHSRKRARQDDLDMNNTPAADEVLSHNAKRSLHDREGYPGLQEQHDGCQGVKFSSTALLSLDLKERISGGQWAIEVLTFDKCDKCDGSGAKSSSRIKGCSDCGGVMEIQRWPFRVIPQVPTCSKCGGGGKIITDYCPKCNGYGKVQSKRSSKVVIPPGVNDGATMKVQVKGSFDKRRGRGGNLYLIIHIKDKDGIWRDGLILHSKIDDTEAMIGTVVMVETVEGLRDLHISPGIQPGDTMMLLSMGVPKLNKPSIQGDHLFIVNLMIIKDISDAEQRLVEELVSVKPSTRVNSSHNNGAPKSNLGKQKIKPWSTSIFFRETKQSFASINVETLKPARIYCKSEVLAVVPILLILLTTCIDSIAGRIGSCRVLNPQRNTQPNSKRNDS